jgi:signal recognition particle receptor subunit beta
MFVVDSANRDRLSEVQMELQALLKNQLMKSKPFVILANKQDVPGMSMH